MQDELAIPEERPFQVALAPSKDASMKKTSEEDDNEVMMGFLDSVTPKLIAASLAPEHLLGRLTPGQRLAALDRDGQALALPVDILRLLPEEYLQALSPEVEAGVRIRLQANRRLAG